MLCGGLTGLWVYRTVYRFVKSRPDCVGGGGGVVLYRAVYRFVKGWLNFGCTELFTGFEFWQDCGCIVLYTGV